MFSLKTWAGILFAFVLVCALFVASIRQIEPDPAQLAALELMRTEMPPVKGRDGSNASWLLGYDVPASEHARRAGQVRAYLVRKFGPDPVVAPGLDPRKQWLAFPRVPDAGDGVCDTVAPACIEYVRKNRAKVESTLKSHARALAANLEFQQFDGMRYGLLPSQSQEYPQFGNGRRLVKTHLAWLFASGQQAEAVAQTCSAIASWRRLGSDNDNLVGNMVAVSFVRQSLVLLAEMLAEMPTDRPLPATCAAALAPASDLERSICASVATEFRGLSVNFYRDLGWYDEPDSIKFLIRHGMDKENYDAMSANSAAQYCSDEARRAARDDTPTDAWIRRNESCHWLRELGDPIGCALANPSFGAGYIKYLDRRLDQTQMLGLMNTLLWLRRSSTAQTEWQGLLKSRPASIGLKRTPRFEGGRLAIPLWDQSREDEFSLPTQAHPTN